MVYIFSAFCDAENKVHSTNINVYMSKYVIINWLLIDNCITCTNSTLSQIFQFGVVWVITLCSRKVKQLNFWYITDTLVIIGCESLKT